jgi:fatty-acyl-CoA synthase
VGKIYKPQLRCDAATRLVQQVLQAQLGLANARVQANEGGSRGMRVAVTLPAVDALSAPAVEEVLARFLFETQVSVGEAGR